MVSLSHWPLSHSRITYPNHKSIYYQTHQLKLIRKSISIDTFKLIASAYILPILDYCNSMLLHLQSHQIARLQTLQNSQTIRCNFKLNHFSHDSISPFLIELHWPSIHQSILCKTLLLTHKAVHHISSIYLTNIILLHRPHTITIRSTNTSHRSVHYIYMNGYYKKYLGTSSIKGNA